MESIKMKRIKIYLILISTLWISSCHTQTQPTGQFVGVKFCHPGIFEIHSDIDHWAMVGNGLWKGQLAQLNVSSTAKNSPKIIPGFFHLQDRSGNIRFQAEVCQNANYPIDKLNIIIVSNVNPGTLSLFMKENITQSNDFVAFNSSHFQCANIHPKRLAIDQENQNLLIRMIFENLPKPIIKNQPPATKQLQKRPVKDTIYSGLYFDDKGQFEITGIIQNHEWKKEPPNQWVANLQRVKVHVQNVICNFSGFRFFKKDRIIDKHRYQMEIDASKKGQVQGPPLKILIKSNSKHPPGVLTFSAKQKVSSQQSVFIPFSADQFQLDNGNRASFLVHDYFTDRPPSICLTFLNINQPATKKIPPKIIQKHKYAIFIPFARTVSKSLSNKISDNFLQSLEKKLIDQTRKLKISTLNYPNNYDPFTEDILNTPVLTLGNQPKDRIVSVIQDSLQHTHYIAFPQLSEDLLHNTLSFKLFVYAKHKKSVTTISEPIDLSSNIQNNILTAMALSTEKLASLSIQQVTATTSQIMTSQVSSGSYKSYEDIYEYIRENHLYCTPDTSNLTKQKAIQDIANKRNMSEQDILSKMKTFAWESNFSIHMDPSSDIIFEIAYNVSTEHIHDFTQSTYSIFMYCLLSKNVKTQSDLQTICQSMKSHAGIDNWRVPTINELIRIFQIKDFNQCAKLFNKKTRYQFWSSSPASQKNVFWLLKVQWDQNNQLHLDAEMATSASNTRMLVVSDNK